MMTKKITSKKDDSKIFECKTDEQLSKEVKKLISKTKRELKKNPKLGEEFFKNKNKTSVFESKVALSSCDKCSEGCTDCTEEKNKKEEYIKTLKEFAKAFQLEKKLIAEFSNEDMAKWLIIKNEVYLETMAKSVKEMPKNFVTGKDKESRIYLINYIRDLLIIFQSYELKVSERTINILTEKGYHKLVKILDILNFIERE